MNKKIISIVVCLVVAIAVIGVFQWKTSELSSPDAENAFETAANNVDMDTYTNDIAAQLSQASAETSSEPTGEPSETALREIRHRGSF